MHQFHWFYLSIWHINQLNGYETNSESLLCSSWTFTVVVIMMKKRGSVAIVKTKDGESGPTPLSVGVPWGDTLAPYLLIIIVDNVIRNQWISSQTSTTKLSWIEESIKSRTQGWILNRSWLRGRYCSISLLLCNAQIITDSTVSVADTVGLQLKISKTE